MGGRRRGRAQRHAAVSVIAMRGSRRPQGAQARTLPIAPAAARCLAKAPAAETLLLPARPSWIARGPRVCGPLLGAGAQTVRGKGWASAEACAHSPTAAAADAPASDGHLARWTGGAAAEQAESAGPSPTRLSGSQQAWSGDLHG